MSVAVITVNKDSQPKDGMGRIWAKFATFNEDDNLTETERTARLVCGMRAFDGKQSSKPLLLDPLGELLAGSNGMAKAALALGERYSTANDTPGQYRHSDISVRAFVLDNEIVKALDRLRSSTPAPSRAQVVNLGAGMDTRPWRLTLGPDVCWWEVDMPDMIQLKTRLLREAGADVDASKQDDTVGAFPLKCGSFQKLSCIFSPVGDGVGLRALLLGCGFDPALPTVWVAEGLVYYLDMPTLTGLLKETAQLSPPGSVTILTALDKDGLQTLQASMLAARKSKQPNALANLWMYHSLEDFATGGSTTSSSLMHELGWEVTLASDLRSELQIQAPGHCAIMPPGKFKGQEMLVMATHM